MNDLNIIQGDIQIKGDNKVKLHIKNKYYYKGLLNSSGDYKNLDVYYYGSLPMKFENNGTKIKGSLYVGDSKIDLVGGVWEGKLVTGSSNVILRNEGAAYSIGIYAPNADINIKGGVINGAIMAKSINIENEGAVISYDSKYAGNINVPFEGPVINELIFESGYFK